MVLLTFADIFSYQFRGFGNGVHTQQQIKISASEFVISSQEKICYWNGHVFPEKTWLFSHLFILLGFGYALETQLSDQTSSFWGFQLGCSQNGWFLLLRRMVVFLIIRTMIFWQEITSKRFYEKPMNNLTL